MGSSTNWGVVTCSGLAVREPVMDVPGPGLTTHHGTTPSGGAENLTMIPTPLPLSFARK